MWIWFIYSNTDLIFGISTEGDSRLSPAELGSAHKQQKLWHFWLLESGCKSDWTELLQLKTSNMSSACEINISKQVVCLNILFRIWIFLLAAYEVGGEIIYVTTQSVKNNLCRKCYISVRIFKDNRVNNLEGNITLWTKDQKKQDTTSLFIFFKPRNESIGKCVLNNNSNSNRWKQAAYFIPNGI